MTITLSVPEISCDHCKSSIEGAVAQVSDVDDVRVDVASKTVHVDGGERTAIVAAIEDIGYDVSQE